MESMLALDDGDVVPRDAFDLRVVQQIRRRLLVRHVIPPRKVTFKDTFEGENVREETDTVTALTQMVIVESATAEKCTPTITIKAGKGEERR